MENRVGPSTVVEKRALKLHVWNVFGLFQWRMVFLGSTLMLKLLTSSAFCFISGFFLMIRSAWSLFFISLTDYLPLDSEVHYSGVLLGVIVLDRFVCSERWESGVQLWPFFPLAFIWSPMHLWLAGQVYLRCGLSRAGGFQSHSQETSGHYEEEKEGSRRYNNGRWLVRFECTRITRSGDGSCWHHPAEAAVQK